MPEGIADVLQIFGSVRRCQETRESFLQMETLLAQMNIKQAGEARFGRKSKVEPRSKVADSGREAAGVE
jgi:hypothetical protein